MNTTIFLRFSDPELAQLLAHNIPPKAITVSSPTTVIQASLPAEIVWQIAISFPVGVGSSLLAAWIFETLKQGASKSSRINRKQVVIDKRSILRLIHQELANQKARDSQRHRAKKKPNK
jgi:hypothetical protein